MRVMFDVTDPDERKHTMTERKGKAEVIDVKALDLTPLRGVQLVTKPVPRRFGNLPTSDDERVIHKNTLANLGIENLVPEGSSRWFRLSQSVDELGGESN